MEIVCLFLFCSCCVYQNRMLFKRRQTDKRDAWQGGGGCLFPYFHVAIRPQLPCLYKRTNILVQTGLASRNKDKMFTKHCPSQRRQLHSISNDSELDPNAHPPIGSPAS
jgi:hypothetical protein